MGRSPGNVACKYLKGHRLCTCPSAGLGACWTWADFPLSCASSCLQSGSHSLGSEPYRVNALGGLSPSGSGAERSPRLQWWSCALATSPTGHCRGRGNHSATMKSAEKVSDGEPTKSSSVSRRCEKVHEVTRADLGARSEEVSMSTSCTSWQHGARAPSTASHPPGAELGVQALTVTPSSAQGRPMHLTCGPGGPLRCKRNPS